MMKMTKKQKDLIVFGETFARHYLEQDPDYLNLDYDMQVLCLSFCAAMVCTLLKYLDISVERKTSNKPDTSAKPN